MDFKSLSESCVEGVNSYMITQSKFLQRMGILERFKMIVKNPNISKKDRMEITSAVERLIGTGDGKMGDVYKVMAVANSRPYAFDDK